MPRDRDALRGHVPGARRDLLDDRTVQRLQRLPLRRGRSRRHGHRYGALPQRRLGSLQPTAELLPVLPVLAVFSALAMLLLMRLQLTQQRHSGRGATSPTRARWAGCSCAAASLFVVVAVAGASSLTAWATVEQPEVETWRALEGPIEDFGEEVARWLGILGAPLDGPTATIRRVTADAAKTLGHGRYGHRLPGRGGWPAARQLLVGLGTRPLRWPHMGP